MIHVCPECGYNEVIDCEEAMRKEREIISRCMYFIQTYASDNPVWNHPELGEQDPSGVHALLADMTAVLTTESASEPKLEEHDLYVYDDAKPLPEPRTCETCACEKEG